ncbi:4'-phosphopantetheinyl transferase superfamily protein [Mesomycoplasma lagogenitalium]|uniref:4'-phosphopantetheinyl transferase superfamily protein n=1 Tax=Mesomycoplasma lagogenitalium TaxID=171286 RepID=A0ABY8LT65_9BACT|nr:4'-phosphopantetheinyl transferase superfamily protein [Mesomycoplasma lagogenitalium]WGI36440.1 4'-phosphopantetheinyl transferase superfamily protein [Mesomycoplasma lagogenitalium]
MIGIDITYISRFKNKSRDFAKKILSDSEMIEYDQIDEKDKFLATRWAIKEAIFKADNSYYEFNKISILKQNRRYFFKNFLISTSSEGESIVAFVVKETLYEYKNKTSII